MILNSLNRERDDVLLRTTEGPTKFLHLKSCLFSMFIYPFNLISVHLWSFPLLNSMVHLNVLASMPTLPGFFLSKLRSYTDESTRGAYRFIQSHRILSQKAFGTVKFAISLHPHPHPFYVSQTHSSSQPCLNISFFSEQFSFIGSVTQVLLQATEPSCL